MLIEPLMKSQTCIFNSNVYYNQRLGRSGAFWQHESYDHCVRNPNELKRIVTYVLNNPVKTGLVDRWEKWPWNYYCSANF